MADTALIKFEKKPLAIRQNSILIEYDHTKDYYSFFYRIDKDRDVQFDESENESEKSEFIDAEFEDKVRAESKPLYYIAATSGFITGIMSFIDFDELVSKSEDWTDKNLKELIKKAAKIAGYKKDDYKGALLFLKKRIVPLVKSQLPESSQAALKKFLPLLSSNASIGGLIFSIVAQFNRKRYSFDEKGNLVAEDVPEYYRIGRSIEEKFAYAVLYWVFSLIVNALVSQKAILDELQIPKHLISIIKDLIKQKAFIDIPSDIEGYEKIYSEWIGKVFEASTVRYADGEEVVFSLSDLVHKTIREILPGLTPVILNECIFRSFYFLHKLNSELRSKKIDSIEDLYKIEPQDILPTDNNVISRMALIASSVFVAINVGGTAIRALVESNGSGKKFLHQFIAHVNIAGIGRFVIALGNDSKNWGISFKGIFTRQDKKYSAFNTIYQDPEFNTIYEVLALTPIQARLMYCLESKYVEYDIRKTKKAEEADKKKNWLRNWQTTIVASMNYEDDDYFLPNEDQIYDYFYEQAKDINNLRWIYLLTMELALFEPYHALGTDADREYKKLKVKADYFKDQFIVRQTIVSAEKYKEIKENYTKAYGMISGKTPQAVISASAALVTIILSGGLALAFAPQIAVLIAGEAVVGLHGAALTSASLAFVGGGALAAGGAGVAGGTAIITGGGALLGLASSGSASAAIILINTSDVYWIRQGAKIATFCNILHDYLEEDNMILGIYNELNKSEEVVEAELRELKADKCGLDKEAISKLETYHKHLTRTKKEIEKIKISKSL